MNYKKWSPVAGRASSFFAIVLCSALLAAQATQNGPASPSADSGLRFEVATIKPHDSTSTKLEGVQIDAGGRVEIIDVPLKSLICIALGVSWWQVSVRDPSAEKIPYDVVAEPPDSMRASITNLHHTWYGIEDARLRTMLTAMLTDRFRLKFHRETRTGTVYMLQRNNKPFRPVASARGRRTEDGEIIDPGIGTIGAAGNWDISDTSMPQLAKFTSESILHAPVLDETHLEGFFDYRSPTEVDMSNMDSIDAAFPSFISEMGLRLKKSQGPVETIVIDHSEKPSEN